MNSSLSSSSKISRVLSMLALVPALFGAPATTIALSPQFVIAHLWLAAILVLLYWVLVLAGSYASKIVNPDELILGMRNTVKAERHR